MKKIKVLIFVSLFTFYFGKTFSQAVDSLGVFPNPFATSATIHFEIVQSDTITLRVFNTFGQTISTFFQSTILPSGSYNINLLGDSLIDGLYIIRLDIGSTKTITKTAVKNNSTSSISDFLSVDKILIFPNPTKDNLTIPIFSDKTIIITDLSGNCIKSFTTDQNEISLLDILAGQYFITVLTTNGEIITTQKIVKCW